MISKKILGAVINTINNTRIDLDPHLFKITVEKAMYSEILIELNEKGGVKEIINIRPKEMHIRTLCMHDFIFNKNVKRDNEYQFNQYICRKCLQKILRREPWAK